ncbi:hypothetical protein BT96DRAFT_782109, partial [Gymnopus androsaceus JB14]
LTMKIYPETSKVLGLYKVEHTHELGNANVCYTRVPEDDRAEIAGLLRMGVEPRQVLKQMHGSSNTESNALNPSEKPALRREFINSNYIRQIRQRLDQDHIRLADSDARSVELHVERLHKKGGLLLFTIMLRDCWGRGFPAAFMFCSDGTDAMINNYLSLLRTWFPNVSLHRAMSDKDMAQINAIRRQYPLARLALCWWHVLHAWQQHFNATEFPELWALLKAWIRVMDQTEFESYWEKIAFVAPTSVREYLERNWLTRGVIEMWSAVYWKGFSIEEESDTNMLTEAWHHLLKGHFLLGKGNRHLDYLIYIITDIAIPHFIVRHRHQLLGFEGLNLRAERRAEAELKGSMILKSDITCISSGGIVSYIVRSQADSEKAYTVALDSTVSCSCLSFPSIEYCKHVHAVHLNFAPDSMETIESLPISSLTTVPSFISSNNNPPPTIESTPQNNDQAQEIQLKLNALAVRLQVEQLSSGLDSELQTFSAALDHFAEALGPSDTHVLPPRHKIAPNQHSWTETAPKMG